MTDTKHISECLSILAAAMVAKGLKMPEAEYVLSANQPGSVRMTWVKDKAKDDWDRVYKFLPGKSFEDALSQATALVDGLPDLAERQRAVFMTALGDVIDLGRANGIEVDFVNPLVETMKRLSENAITHHRSAVAA